MKAVMVMWLGLTTPGLGQIAVGANVHVSKQRDTLVHDEVMIGADPRNPSRILACSIAHVPGRRELETFVYTTIDGGTSWRPTVVDTGNFAGDPVCGFDAKGNGYFISIAYGGKELGGMSFFRSTDGGSTWLAPTKVKRVPDRPQMSIDQTGGKYDGRIYIAFNADLEGVDQGQRKPAFGLITSSDGGVTFSNPVMRAVLDPDAVAYAPIGTGILSDGTLVIVVQEWVDLSRIGPQGITSARMKALISTDGGGSLEVGVPITDVRKGLGMTTGDVPSIAVDGSSGPFKDRIYVVFDDARSGRNEIYLTYSATKGKTWSRPIRVNDDRAWPIKPNGDRGPNHTMAQVAVNKDGIVGVMWYDRRENPDDVGYFVRFSGSLDGGDTWLPSVRVSEKPKASASDEPWAFDVSGVTQADSTTGSPQSLKVRRSEWVTGGHTAGVAARADGVFFPLWVDDRTGRHQVFTAPVTVSGKAVKNGSTELADYVDVTAKLKVELTYVTHDRGRGTLTLTAKLNNVSKDTVRGQVKLRALAFASPVAEVTPANADNGVKGVGAIWDLTATLPTGGLAPDSSGATKTLVFRLSDLRPSHPSRNIFEFDVMDLDVRVLLRRD